MTLLSVAAGLQIENVVDIAFYRENGEDWFRGIFCYVGDETKRIWTGEIYFTEWYKYESWLTGQSKRMPIDGYSCYYVDSVLDYVRPNYELPLISPTVGIPHPDFEIEYGLHGFQEQSDQEIWAIESQMTPQPYSIAYDRFFTIYAQPVDIRKSIFVVAKGNVNLLEAFLSSLPNGSSISGIIIERIVETNVTEISNIEKGCVSFRCDVQVPYRITKDRVIDVNIVGDIRYFASYKPIDELKPPITIIGW